MAALHSHSLLVPSRCVPKSCMSRSCISRSFISNSEPTSESTPQKLARSYVPLTSDFFNSSKTFLLQNTITGKDASRFHAFSHTPTRFFTASTSATSVSDAPSVSGVEIKRNTWTWNYEGEQLKTFFVEHSTDGQPNRQPPIIMLPSLSDVSTVEEWHDVAQALASEPGKERKVFVVDFPGFGASDSPPLDYTSDMLEKFISEFITSNPSLKQSDGLPPVLIGCGHSGIIALKAVSEKQIPVSALGFVAPTWAGPLPIVFGKSEKMEFRYGLLRNAIRSPVLGWGLYKYVLSSPKNVKSQYLSHVYSDKNNVTESLIENRVAVIQREGARFAPASFISGRLDPVSSRGEFLKLFESVEGKIPTLVVSTIGCPRRSKAEMESLENARGVSKFVRVNGALLAHEEYPSEVTREIIKFLNSV